MRPSSSFSRTFLLCSSAALLAALSLCPGQADASAPGLPSSAPAVSRDLPHIPTLRTNTAPVASVSVSHSPISVGHGVTLDGTGSHDAEGPITSYFWNWQDESGAWVRSASGPVLSTSWSQPGTYGVILVVYDGANVSGTTTVWVTVQTNTPPVAAFVSTPSPAVSGRAVVLDGSGSHDAEGAITAYFWNWQDESGAWVRSAIGRSVGVSWSQPGTYGVILVVYDGDNVQHTVQHTVTVNPPPALDVDVDRPGASVERSQCPTFAVGGGAYECGDLRLAHALPAVRTYGKTRSPVLLYNGDQASPQPIVAANLTLPAGITADRVDLTVALNGAAVVSGTWAGWPGGETRRVALTWDGSALATGLYPYTLQATAYSGSTLVGSFQATGELAVVNRSASPFGAGWWVAGLEQLVAGASGAPILWVGGDGSTRVYRPVSGVAGRWAADIVSRPDTLKALTGGGWVRELPGGAKVFFDAAGRHTSTQPRTGAALATGFTYTGALLSGITVPGPAGYGYTLAYTGSRLVSATLNAGAVHRTVSFAPASGDARIWDVTDPDGSVVHLGYGTTGAAQNRVAWRTDERGTKTRYTYDAGWRLSGAVTEMQGQGPDITVGFTAQETRGLAGGAAAVLSSVRTTYDGPRTDVADVTQLYTERTGGVRKVVNAAGDSTVLTHDLLFPALVKEVNAPGAVYNGVATRQVSRAWYGQRGQVDSTQVVDPLGDGESPIVRYAYEDPRWPDFATRARTAGGTLSHTSYDALGNRVSEQVGEDANRRVIFHYDTLNRVDWVQGAAAGLRGDSVERVLYDPVLGNVSETLSPLKARTVVLSDALGRAYLTRSYIDATHVATDSTVYDVMDRVTDTYGYAPSLPYTTVAGSAQKNTAAPTLRVHNTYDAGGLLLRVDRWSEPDPDSVGTISTRWTYDPAGRRITEVAPHTPADSINPPLERTIYDVAGNPARIVTRMGDTIRTKYDVLGRMTDRIVPVHVEGGDTVPGDSAHFAYDAAGGMTQANNATARISRTYFPGGALRTDSSWVVSSTGSFVASQHRYGIEHVYDREGRQIALKHPQTLTPSGAAWQTTFAYDSTTGALASVTDPMGHANRFTYTLEGQLDTLVLPGGIRETHHYDADGRMTRRIRGLLYDDSLAYDRRGKVTTARTLADVQQMAYDGLGHLVWSFQDRIVNTPLENDSEEEYGFDALGNTTFHTRTSLTPGQVSASGVAVLDRYERGTGRHVQGRTPQNMVLPLAAQRNDQYTYNAAGDAVTSASDVGLTIMGGPSGQGSGPQTLYFTPDYIPMQDGQTSGNGMVPPDFSGQQTLHTRSSYRADGKLAAFKRDAGCLWSTANTACTYDAPGYGSQNVKERYGYDALGRRVVVRTETHGSNYQAAEAGVAGALPVYPGDCPSDLPRCDNTTKRTVWDGDQVLYEMRYPNGQADQEAGLDSTNQAALAYRDSVRTAGIDMEPGYVYGGPNTSKWAPSGRVAYVHAGGLDEPIGLLRMDYSYDFAAPVLIVPHANWKSAYETSTFASGLTAQCDTVWLPVSEAGTGQGSGPNGGQFGADSTDTGWSTGADVQQQRCIERDFPGAYMSVSRLLKRQTVYGPTAWMGSLVQDAQDASGLMYRRNRYYDPQTGKFTQEDPAGLAGGINAYGFANGDPISYSDPYGLKAEGCCPEWLVNASAGFGDALSFGLTDLARTAMGTNDVVHKGSGAYIGGTAAGVVVGTVATAGIGTEAQAVSAARNVRVVSVAESAARGGVIGFESGAERTVLQTGERALLRDFFGQGIAGAERRSANFAVPEGLGEETLLKYRRVALDAIDKGIDRTGVQAERLKLIERAINVLRR